MLNSQNATIKYTLNQDGVVFSKTVNGSISFQGSFCRIMFCDIQDNESYEFSVVILNDKSIKISRQGNTKYSATLLEGGKSEFTIESGSHKLNFEIFADKVRCKTEKSSVNVYCEYFLINGKARIKNVLSINGISYEN